MTERAATPDPPDQPAGQRAGAPSGEHVEHRLALVMNGGVSLAVWMGGVAREIDNARRASLGLPLPPEATDTERISYQRWVDATAKKNVSVTVDVIAGTSAGGLNGVLLAAAIARGAPLSRWLRDLWLGLGQLSDDALLTPQDDPQSLLNGDFFHTSVKNGLDTMPRMPEDQRREVSLFVTSTALGPSARKVCDSSGRHFTEDDHRRRFHFSRHRARPTYTPGADGRYALGTGDEVDHFATSEPLATAARATASFPAAFKPVAETPELRARRVWPDWQTSPRLDWLADGGILDNSPFGPLLDSIQHKPVDGAWRRTVCYIVPAGDTATPTGVGRLPAAPTAGVGDGPVTLPPSWVSVALSSFSLPREADFRDDVEQLHETIRAGRTSLEVRRFRSLTTDQGAPQQLAMARQILAEGIALYRQSCLPTAIYQVRDIAVRSSADGYLTPARPVVLGETEGLALYPPPRSWLPKAVPAATDALPDAWDWGVSAAGRVLRTLLRAAPGSDLPDGSSLRSVLSQAVDEVTAVEFALDARLSAVTTNGEVPGDEAILALVDDAYQALGIPATVAGIVNSAVTAYSQGTGRTVSPVDVLAGALAVEASNGAGSLPGTEARPLFDFDRLGLDDPPPLLQDVYDDGLRPPEGGGGHTPSRNDIVYGSRLHHFAGFAIEAWRQWDWMWGRLSGLAHLARLLGLDPDDVDQLALAIIDDEGMDLTQVREQVGVVLGMTPQQVNERVLTSGDLPALVDSALALLRTEGHTAPPPPAMLVHTGQALSDAIARHGHTGDVHSEGIRGAALPLRHHLWKILNREE